MVYSLIKGYWARWVELEVPMESGSCWVLGFRSFRFQALGVL